MGVVVVVVGAGGDREQPGIVLIGSIHSPGFIAAAAAPRAPRDVTSAMEVQFLFFFLSYFSPLDVLRETSVFLHFLSHLFLVLCH